MSDEKKKMTAAEMYESVSQLLEGLMNRMDLAEQRLEEQDGMLEAHGLLLTEQEKIEGEFEPLEKERYPAKMRAMADNPDSAVRWVRVTPKQDYCDPGVQIDGFVVPFKKGVTMWTLTPFQQEAMGRGVL